MIMDPKLSTKKTVFAAVLFCLFQSDGFDVRNPNPFKISPETLDRLTELLYRGLRGWVLQLSMTLYPNSMAEAIDQSIHFWKSMRGQNWVIDYLASGKTLQVWFEETCLLRLIDQDLRFP